MNKTCNTCKHWQTDVWDDFSVYAGDVHFPCEHPKNGDERATDGMAANAYFPGSDSLSGGNEILKMNTGPDFGCIHHEEK